MSAQEVRMALAELRFLTECTCPPGRKRHKPDCASAYRYAVNIVAKALRQAGVTE